MANEKWLIDVNKVINCMQNVLDEEVNKNSVGYFAFASIIECLKQEPTVDAVPVEQYKALLDMYHDLRENFIDYYCSGAQNVAPYCLNKCEECVDKWGYCKQYSDYCKGFNPAEVILDGEMDGDGNGT